MNSSRSSTLAVITFTLCAQLPCCTRSTGPLCVDHLCFDLPLNTPVRSREQKHSILPENAAGWIDVQKYTPPMQPTATLATLSNLFAQRHALSSAVHVISHQTAMLPRMNREVPVVDLTIEWHGATYRRRSWLLAGDEIHSWTVIDVTTPATRWTEAEQTLVPLVLAMHAL